MEPWWVKDELEAVLRRNDLEAVINILAVYPAAIKYLFGEDVELSRRDAVEPSLLKDLLKQVRLCDFKAFFKILDEHREAITYKFGEEQQTVFRLAVDEYKRVNAILEAVDQND